MVAITVCNMSVIIPAILRALGVGDPFMREDTVAPNFSTLEMAPTTSTRIELSLPKIRGRTTITDSDESEGVNGTAKSLRQYSGYLDTKDDREHSFMTQTSDGLFRNPSTRKTVSLTDDSGVADLLAHVRSLPTVKRYQGVEGNFESRSTKSNNV